MKDTLDFYSKIYNPLFCKEQYNKSLHRGGKSLEIFEIYSKNKKINIKSIVDVGCSWGKTLKYWKERGIEATGVDVPE